MLSRTASNLYWIGRYMERAEFTASLVEATIRLDSLGLQTQSDQAWRSALAVVGATAGFADTEEKMGPFAARRYLTLSEDNPNSVRSCLTSARDNARAARNALSREAWEAINRAWLTIRSRASPGGTQATLTMVDALRADTRGFEGALMRMLRADAFWFVRLGQMIERADNTARLLDVKYYLLLPEGEEVGGTLDRDQWNTILHIVSARLAYRLLYPEGLRPWLVADLLVFRRELPRSLHHAAAETVELLSEFGARTGRQGEADRLARQRLAALESDDITSLFQRGLHEWLSRYIDENDALGRAIAHQFRFP
jgi:uncharacterized alpha-E superfamily protein